MKTHSTAKKRRIYRRRKNFILFSGRANQKLAKKIARSLGVKMGKVKIRNFSDGEIDVQYLENIRGKNVVIIQSTQPPGDNILELEIMIDAAKRASAKQVIVVIPYFGYARQDRKDRPRVSITAKLMVRKIQNAGADRVIVADLHAPQIQGFFDIPVDPLYCSKVVLPYLRRVIRGIPRRKLAFAAPDVGAAPMVRAWAKRVSNSPVILIDKRRPKANQAEVMNIVGDPRNKVIILVDDLLDTFGTLENAIEALLKKGALQVIPVVIHPLCSGEAFQRMAKAPVKLIIVCNTLPIEKRLQEAGLAKKVKVVNTAPLFAVAIDHAVKNLSISKLFDADEMKR